MGSQEGCLLKSILEQQQPLIWEGKNSPGAVLCADAVCEMWIKPQLCLALVLCCFGWLNRKRKEMKKDLYVHKKPELDKTWVIYSILSCHQMIVPGLKSLL